MTKNCRVCKTPFEPRNSLQKVCNAWCAYQYAKEQAEKKRKAAEKARSKADRKRKEAIKPRSEWLREAQSSFNAYIRARDSGRACISCGITTGQMHAGHYRTTKAASHLRFNPRNCHQQCAQCNNSKSGNIVEYRIRLVERIGLAEVERLEHDNRTRKWTIDELKRIKSVYNRKARHYKKLRERDQAVFRNWMEGLV